jgi:hypothetical protein
VQFLKRHIFVQNKIRVWGAIFWKGTLVKTKLGFGVQFLESHIVQNKIRVSGAIFGKSHCSNQN